MGGGMHTLKPSLPLPPLGLTQVGISPTIPLDPAQLADIPLSADGFCRYAQADAAPKLFS